MLSSLPGNVVWLVLHPQRPPTDFNPNLIPRQFCIRNIMIAADLCIWLFVSLRAADPSMQWNLSTVSGAYYCSNPE